MKNKKERVISPALGTGEIQFLNGSIILRKKYDMNLLQNNMNDNLETNILFNESITPISYVDADGILVKVNPAYCALFSSSEIDLLGNDFTIHFSNLDSDAKKGILKKYKKFYLQGEKDNFEAEVFTKTGEVKIVEITRKFMQLPGLSKVCVSFLTDVTKYKLANEKVLNAVFNAIAGVVYHVRLDSEQKRKMIFMSERADVIFGHSSKEIQNDISLIMGVLHPEDVITPTQSLEIFRKNNNFRRIQYRVKNKTGGWKWLEERSILMEAGGNEYDLYGMITDITDSKVSNKRLEDLRFALDQSAIVSITDKDGNIIDFNENFSKVSGYSRQEIIGQNHRITNSGFHTRQFFTDMWSEISSGKVWQGEIKNMRKDGTYYWVYSHIIPFLDDQGKPFQYISIRNEITQRKEAEESLAASEGKYRLLYENAPIGIVIVDPQATILDCNTHFLNLLGYEKGEVIGKKSFSFLHEDFIEYKSTALTKLFKGEIKRFYIEEKRRTRDGNYVWIGCYSNAITDEFGNVIYRLDFITDIENRKKSEEQFLKLDQSKNAILNIVAHDLRSPIIGVTNLARLLLKLEHSVDKHNYLELMENSGNHALNIIQDILDMVQLEQDVHLSNIESTELNEFIKNCIKIHQIQSKEKSIQIKFHSSVEKVYHDINQDKMERVISNLISNAIKFSNENGIVEVFLYRERNKTIIQIKDYGIGIPKEMHDILFEKFGAARRVGTKGEKTIGLGLSIAKEIIDKHQGKIKVESEENKGSSFFIEL